MIELFTYWRSSASYRVRIALELKGVSRQDRPVNVLQGEQGSDWYRETNPQALVPSLRDGQALLTQSLAILEYLEECHPQPPLLPPDAVGRALVRSLALDVCCDIHPLQNLRVMKKLGELGQDKQQVEDWVRHWIQQGLDALELRVTDLGCSGAYLYGSQPGLADVCLVPQMANARRWGCSLKACTTLVTVDAHCQQHPAFRAAAPQVQPDAPSASHG